MRLGLLFLVGIWFAACSSDPEETSKPECNTFQFRACLTQSGEQGKQQCLEPGVWSPCSTSVYDDASYADHGHPDADGDSDGDAGDAGDAGDVEESGDGDAAEDVELDGSDAGDAGEASLLD